MVHQEKRGSITVPAPGPIIPATASSTPTPSSSITVVPLPIPSPLPAAPSSAKSDILYHNKAALNVGQVLRYKITYTPPDTMSDSTEPLWIKVKNLEVVALRAAYLAGPFILYVDVRPEDYDENKKVESLAEQPHYEPQLKAGQSFYAPLHIDSTPRKRSYTWVVDVVSQIIFSISAQVQFEISVGFSKESLRTITVKTPSNSTSTSSRTTFGPLPSSGLIVSSYDTLDLWSLPAPKLDKPLHLVIITHGLHSNTGADMLYAKEAIDKAAQKSGENVIVRGYFGNVRKTEKGVRYLGRRLAEYIVNEAAPETPPPNTPPVAKISLIAHSLGGLVQTYAIAHIVTHHPEFFNRVEPINFIALASPFLGISNENPYYVKFALDIGFVGKSGQDLSLSKSIIPGQQKPLLRILPTGPTHAILKRFKKLTLYANTVNDGIVPLRTSAILYLDWMALGQVDQVIKQEMQREGEEEVTEPVHPHEEKKHCHPHHLHLHHHHEGNTGTGEITDVPLSERTLEDEPQDQPHSPRSPDNASIVGEIPERYDELPATELSNTSHDKTASGMFGLKASGDLFSPVQSMFSLFAPSAQRKPPKIYKHSQTLPLAGEGENEGDARASTSVASSSTEGVLNTGDLYGRNEESDKKSKRFFRPYIPPKTGVIESGVSVLLPPLPPDSFILDPSTRPKTIEHDRLYRDDDLPPRRFRKRTSSKLLLGQKKSDEVVDRSKVEERIARDWHRDLTWRKVLVRLEPDAHNNIIVRRRFANSYGWPVIEHLVENHFGSASNDTETTASETTTVETTTSIVSSRIGNELRPATPTGLDSATPLAVGVGNRNYFGVSALDILKTPYVSVAAALAAVTAGAPASPSASTEEEGDENGKGGGDLGCDEEDTSTNGDQGALSQEVYIRPEPNDSDDDDDEEDDFEKIEMSDGGPLQAQDTGSSSSSGSSCDTTSTVDASNAEAWKAYLSPEHVENEEDGLLFQMGNMFDNIREIGNLNFAGLSLLNRDSPKLEPTESTDEPEIATVAVPPRAVASPSNEVDRALLAAPPWGRARAGPAVTQVQTARHVLPSERAWYDDAEDLGERELKRSLYAGPMNDTLL